VTIGPSRARSLLVAALALGGVRALWICELPSEVFALLAFATLALAVRDLRRTNGGTTLELDENGLWHVRRPRGETFSGRLADRGYRSAVFVSLVIESEAEKARLLPRRHHVAVPVDSVAPVDFSFLHLQLAHPGARS